MKDNKSEKEIEHSKNEEVFVDNGAIEKELYNISLFIKIGIVVLSFILALALGVKYIPDAVTVTNTGKKRDLPIYSVEMDEPKISLSFDVAWGNEDVDIILDILAKHDVKATFFITGEWVRKYPDDVQAIATAGHDLGNHGDNHKHMSQLSAEDCRDEILKMHNRVKELIGKDMNLFRPPYGDYNNSVIGTARECGYYSIQWDVDSLDWKDYGVNDIIKRCTQDKNLGNGSIILLHSGTKYTKDALEAVIVGLKEKGYQLVPVSELIYKENFDIDNAGRQFKR